MEWDILASLLHATIAAGTPVLFAALGELLTERSGVLNLGVEGVMLTGAVTGFAVGTSLSNPAAGLGAALCVGALLGLLYGLLCIHLRVDQVVCGIALTIFGIGLSGLLGSAFIGRPLSHPITPVRIPWFGDIPFVGSVFFHHDLLVYFSFLLAPFLWFTLYRTRAGLHLRAVGENPRAADTLGIAVGRLRYLYTSLGSALVALGGADLTLAYLTAWHENATAGRGWIAVALVIFSGWNPLAAMAGSYLFGGVDAATLYVQALGTSVPPHFLGMIPYVMTVVVLVITGRKRRGGARPQALAVPYDSEER